MEAKDTIINIVDRGGFNVCDVLEEQAEISFKAGIKEVVEWIPILIEAIKKKMWSDDWGVEHSVIYPDMLDELVKKKTKAKLNEWGVND